MKKLLIPLLCALQAPAASIFFEPSGSQLDSDAILDLILQPGSRITFRVYADPAGLAFPLHDLRYRFYWDPSELEYIDIELDPDKNFAVDRRGFYDDLPTGISRGWASHLTGSVTKIVLLDKITFEVLPGLVNDGVRDFAIFLEGAATLAPLGYTPRLGSATDSFTPRYQQVEVQPAPEPASLVLIGFGLLAMGWVGRKRTGTG